MKVVVCDHSRKRDTQANGISNSRIFSQDERPSAFKLAINPIRLRVNLFQDLTSSSLFSWRFNWAAISSRILCLGETSGMVVVASGLEFDGKSWFKGSGK